MMHDAPPADAQHPTPNPRRRGSRIIFWYVSREFLVPLTSCICGFITLFLITNLLDDMQDFVEAKTAFSQVALYFALQQPVNLVHVLPMSILLAASFMVNILSRHHEVLAMRASGLSLVRCFSPVWLVAAAFSVTLFWLNAGLAPACAIWAEEILDRNTAPNDYKRKHEGKLAFRNSRTRRDWFFASFNRNGEQGGVLIKQFRKDGTIDWELRAETAFHTGTEWVFEDGMISRFDQKGELPEGPEESFERLPMPELQEHPSQILNSLKPVEQLSMREMLSILRTNRDLPLSTKLVFRTELWFRSFFSLSCIIGALLGVSLSLTRERGNALRGFAGAVMVMVLYYIVAQFFVLLGKNGVVPPFVAGSLPTLFFAGWGGREMGRKR